MPGYISEVEQAARPARPRDVQEPIDAKRTWSGEIQRRVSSSQQPR
jgi:hypothetical protein